MFNMIYFRLHYVILNMLYSIMLVYILSSFRVFRKLPDHAYSYHIYIILYVMSAPIVPYYIASVLHHHFMFMLKRFVFHILKLQWQAFRTNCDSLIANCKSPLPGHKPQPQKLRFLKNLLQKSPPQSDSLFPYFLGEGGKMLKWGGG